MNKITKIKLDKIIEKINEKDPKIKLKLKEYSGYYYLSYNTTYKRNHLVEVRLDVYDLNNQTDVAQLHERLRYFLHYVLST